MIPFLINILLALIWAALLGNFSEINVLLGFVQGYVVLWIMREALGYSSYPVKVVHVIRFALFFGWELLLANVRMTISILMPNRRMRPAIVGVPLDVTTDTQIWLLANMITLTPGTLSLDVSTDQQTLYVHSIYVTDPEAFRREIKDGFEKKVLEVTQ